MLLRLLVTMTLNSAGGGAPVTPLNTPTLLLRLFTTAHAPNRRFRCTRRLLVYRPQSTPDNHPSEPFSTLRSQFTLFSIASAAPLVNYRNASYAMFLPVKYRPLCDTEFTEPCCQDNRRGSSSGSITILRFIMTTELVIPSPILQFSTTKLFWFRFDLFIWHSQHNINTVTQKHNTVNILGSVVFNCKPINCTSIILFSLCYTMM